MSSTGKTQGLSKSCPYTQFPNLPFFLDPGRVGPSPFCLEISLEQEKSLRDQFPHVCIPPTPTEHTKFTHL